jgi:hypothetical protein
MKKAQPHNQLCFDFEPKSRHRYEILNREFDVEESLEKSSSLHGPPPKSWAVRQIPVPSKIVASLPSWHQAPSGNPYAHIPDETADLPTAPIRERGLRARRAKLRRIRHRELLAFCRPFYDNSSKSDRARLRDWIGMAVVEINRSDELVEHVRDTLGRSLLPFRREDEKAEQNRPKIEGILDFLRRVLHVTV